MSNRIAANDNTMQPQPSQPGERRREPRRRAFLKGKVVYPHNTLSTDCTIKDLAAGGARIAMGAAPLGEESVLIVVKDGVAHQARTAWSHDGQAGLKFEKSFDLRGEAPTHLQHARRLWIELAPR
ncbi:MAG: PilZ domain-containing protein [Caulobacteraceae bacterium]|nr:PilZ domain-containing protein [Caulobacteraceae bacterium]